MTRSLICSDSHGAARRMGELVALEKPDLLLFLGDGDMDLEKVRKLYPDLKTQAVRGNCDRATDAPLVRVLKLEGRTLYLSHGHEHNVKYDKALLRLRYAAAERGANAALFGHTHQQRLEDENGFLTLNPGSLKNGKYAVMVVDGESVTAELKTVSE